MRYNGGKNEAGVYQRIINQIPPHAVYIEPFAGSAAIARRKRPAARTILVEIDPGAIAKLTDASSPRLPPETQVLQEDGIAFLRAYPFLGTEFVYCDPPYLPETRRKERIYAHELSRADHERLLGVLLRVRCPVAISGYDSPLYAEALRGWRTIRYPVLTRGGTIREELLWLNYPEPVELHDSRYVGSDYRARENLARQKRRWVARLKRMTSTEAQAVLDAIRESGLMGKRYKWRWRPGQAALAGGNGQAAGHRGTPASFLP
jgi:hypothetical protein